MGGTVLRGFAVVLALSQPVKANDLGQPTGEVILTITGEISHTNAPQMAIFDLAMIKAMDPVTIHTTTVWTEGVQEFTGVRLKALLDRVGATGQVIDAWAVNDYWAEIPLLDVVDEGPIVAYAQNGHPLSPRDRGPLWVIYPFDGNPAYQTESIYARNIWQVERFEIRN